MVGIKDRSGRERKVFSMFAFPLCPTPMYGVGWTTNFTALLLTQWQGEHWKGRRREPEESQEKVGLLEWTRQDIPVWLCPFFTSYALSPFLPLFGN